MQSFTAQPLVNQTGDNPLTNPLLLATLIIPHLDTYIATHHETRFLVLEYSPQYLSTVLYLQKLVGDQLLKVAGILDSEAGEPRALPRPRFSSPAQDKNPDNRMSSFTPNGTIMRATCSLSTLGKPASPRTTETSPFSKANFLLTSPATDSEVATFLSTIWKTLIDVSDFYIPDDAPRLPKLHTHRIRKDMQLAQSRFEPDGSQGPLANAAIMMGFKAPSVSSLATGRGEKPYPPMPARPASPVKSSRSSIAETVRTMRTTRSIKSQRNKFRALLRREGELDADQATIKADNESYLDFDDDDDDDRLAEDERKYVPLFLHQMEARKGNTRKALKWLGLA